MNYFKSLNRENFPIVQKKTFEKIFSEEGKKYYAYSQVCLTDKEGNRYVGRSWVKPEDAKYFSHITGYKIAEHRAYISYLQYNVQVLKYAMKHLRWILEDESEMASMYDNNEIRLLKHKIIDFKKAIKQGKKYIKEAYKYINNLVEDSWKVTDKIERKIGQKNLINIL